MHDTVDVGEAVAFWTALLGLEVVHRDERYAYMGPMTEGGPYLAFQQVPEAKTSKNRLHLDVRVPNRAEFVERIEALGGTTIGEHQEGDYPSWIVMTDPQGNEFCVYESSTD